MVLLGLDSSPFLSILISLVWSHVSLNKCVQMQVHVVVVLVVCACVNINLVLASDLFVLVILYIDLSPEGDRVRVAHDGRTV